MSDNDRTAERRRAPASDGPLLDLTDAGVKKFIKQAKARGYVTMDELNKVLPSRGSHLRGDRGHPGDALRDGRQRRRGRGGRARAGGRRGRGARGDRRRRDRRRKAPTTAPTIRCACTCARWARWSCFSREGEIAIAKRIEAGRDTMIRGLCESALTFEAIMVWREELGLGRILLREVIDLEQTYGGQVAQALADAGRGRRGTIEAEPQPQRDEDEDGAKAAAAGRQRRRRRFRRRRRPDHQRHGGRAARRRHGHPRRHRRRVRGLPRACRRSWSSTG